ncbi:MAG: protein kinase, partial [Bradymonadaceae bacterium]
MSDSFGRYELIDQIGTGGMAEVYLAKSVGAEGLEKDLVIKKILPEYAENDRFVDMFISEADIAVGLNHPNIVQIYDFGKVDDDYFLAMEYVDGPDLAGLLEAGRLSDEPMDVGDAIYIGIEVAKGLHYAHQRTDQYGDPLGLVHRDISPQNVLISNDGAVKIVDFGIAKATSVAEQDPDVVKGKYRYMSPEQANGEDLDHRSDLFSLGIVLFEHMLYKVLERDPEDRYQSARQLQVDLTKVLYNLGEIHDAMTLARHVDAVSEHLDDGTGVTGSDAGTIRTSVLNTATHSPDAAGTRNADEEATPAETVFQEEGPEQEGEPPAKAARQRKEAVFIHGEIEGLLELKSVIDEHREWIQVLEEYTRIVDSITFKNDGRVHHVDETGFLILVSSENDAVRGTRVAMDLQEAISGINLSLETPMNLAIGVAIGEVLVEQEERSQGPRYNWTFYGDSYQYAERLAKMAMAKETLLSPQVFRRVRRDFEADAVSENRADDEDEPPSAFRLVGPKSPEDRIQEVRRSYYSF